MSVGSSLDEGSSIVASEPDQSSVNSADLQEESDLGRSKGRRNQSNIRATRGGVRVGAKQVTVVKRDDDDDGATLRVGRSVTEAGDDFNEVEEGDEQMSMKEWVHMNAMRVIDQNKEGPWFMHSAHIMDEMERRPDHPDYDPSTLHIPKQEWNRLSDGMIRYWEIKAKNFDKIVLYRYGHWFIVYYTDADICNRHIDLCIPPR